MLEGVNPASRFPCSVSGYEAACYSHIWSQVCYLTITWNIVLITHEHILHSLGASLSLFIYSFTKLWIFYAKFATWFIKYAILVSLNSSHALLMFQNIFLRLLLLIYLLQSSMMMYQIIMLACSSEIRWRLLIDLNFLKQ